MPSSALPPLFANTATDHGARPVVMGYIGAGVTIAVTAIRLGLTVNRSHGFHADDYTFAAAAVIAVGASVTLERAVDVGLGRHADVLSEAQLNAYVRLTYATALLGIFAQAAAKLSVAFLYERLVPRQDKRGVRIVLGIVAVWIVFAAFATAFQCGGSVSWAQGCSTKGYVLFSVAATNLLSSIVHLSAITATIPRINSFIADMQTRRAGIALTQRDYESYKHSKSGSKNGSGNRSHNRSGKFSRSKSPEALGVLDSFRPERSQNIRNEFSSSKPPAEEIEMDNRDQVETGSQSSLRGNAVYWKTEFRWEEEYTGQDGSGVPSKQKGMQRY